MLLLLNSVAEAANKDSTTVVSDLSNGWMVNENENFRLISPKEIGNKAIHFYLSAALSHGTNLYLKIPKGSSLWVDNSLLVLFNEDTTIVESPAKLLQNRSEVLISIFGNNLSRNNLETKLIKTSFIQTVKSINRTSNNFSNFFLISFFGGLLVIIIFKMNSAGNVQEYFAFDKIFLVRKRDEVIYKSKLLTAPNPSFFLLLSFLGSQIVVVFLALSPQTLSFEIDVNNMTIGELLLLQFLLLIGFYIWTILKWVIVRNIGALFRLTEFGPVHFFNYERFSLLVLLIVSVFLFLVSFGLNNPEPIARFFIGFIVLAFTLRILIILFKLLNGSSYKFLHLFSYLCATEIIPYLFAIKLILI